jgi:hypothetical protein
LEAVAAVVDAVVEGMFVVVGEMPAAAVGRFVGVVVVQTVAETGFVFVVGKRIAVVVAAAEVVEIGIVAAAEIGSVAVAVVVVKQSSEEGPVEFVVVAGVEAVGLEHRSTIDDHWVCRRIVVVEY